MICLILNSIDISPITREQGKELHLFDGDVSKAFDSVEHWALELSMRRVGIPHEGASISFADIKKYSPPARPRGPNQVDLTPKWTLRVQK